MFSKSHQVHADLSYDLREQLLWDVGILHQLNIHHDITAVAIEPLTGLLAIGTAVGSVVVYGGPSVSVTLHLPQRTGIVHLCFASNAFKLVCADARHQLHVWNLASNDLTKPQKSTQFENISALTLSSCHTHAIIALSSGIVATYDLLCLRKSQYSIPNLWLMMDSRLNPSINGLTPVGNLSLDSPVQVLHHPRDLNLLFIVYRGAIILWNLTEKRVTRTYQLIIPAGAPGSKGRLRKDLMTHRALSVTTMAIHPAGHFFAGGYEDGTIAFWAVEDDDRPLFVRTIEETDINVVNADLLEQYLAEKENPSDSPHGSGFEPIIQLAWCGFPNSSDPRCGETALIILGGQASGDSVHVLVQRMPAFNPTETSGTELSPAMRHAMRASSVPSSTYAYFGKGNIHRFELVPRDSPHFVGTWDPVAIILLSSQDNGPRSMETFSFPPPSFLRSGNETKADEGAPKDIVDELADTLADAMADDDPKAIDVPPSLWTGHHGILSAQLMVLPNESYETLVKYTVPELLFPLTGGAAYVPESRLSNAKQGKYQPHRILVTVHQDLSLRFSDVSAQILVASSEAPLSKHYPCPLYALVIDVSELCDQGIVSILSNGTYPRVISASLASETLECAVALDSGEVIFYRLGENISEQSKEVISSDSEIALFQNLLVRKSQGFFPFMMLKGKSVAVSAVAVSNVGFFAVGYTDGSVVLVNLRGPVVMKPERNAGKRHSRLFHLHRHDASAEHVVSLNWFISGLSTDEHLRVRLLVIHASGATDHYSIMHEVETSSWKAEKNSALEALPNVLRGASFLVDARSGLSIETNRSRFAATYSQANATDHCYWITANADGARCILDVDGERVGKVDWSNRKHLVTDVQLVSKNGSQVLVAITSENDAMVYSLPQLEYIFTIPIPKECRRVVSIDDSGDFVSVITEPSGLATQVKMSSLFSSRRYYGPPVVDLTRGHRNPMPSQPQPVSTGPVSALGAWLQFNRPATGDQVDKLFAGPDRPVPEASWNVMQQIRDTVGEDSIAGAMNALEQTRGDVYSHLTSALSERGQMLGDLEQQMNSLGEGSKKMVDQAQRIAAEQSAKRWFQF